MLNAFKIMKHAFRPENSKEEKSSGNLDLDKTPPLNDDLFDESFDSDDDIKKPPNPPGPG